MGKMVQIENVIASNLVELLEDYFCEEAVSHWSIIQKTDNDAHRLAGYFETEREAVENWEALRVVFAGVPGDFELRVIEDREWQDEYKKYLRPWSCRDLHWVPVWERYNYGVQPGESVVYFDAGMAFGTGAHETTRLCGQRLVDFRDERCGELGKLSVIDVGCGSGILGISAKLLGFGEVMGFDIDEEAVRVSEENAGFNGVGQEMAFKVAGLEEGLEGVKGDLVLANILANVLCQYSDILLKAIKPGGSLVLSGILVEEGDGVRECFCVRAGEIWGEYEIDSRVLGEWVDFRLSNRSSRKI